MSDGVNDMAKEMRLLIDVAAVRKRQAQMHSETSGIGAHCLTCVHKYEHVQAYPCVDCKTFGDYATNKPTKWTPRLDADAIPREAHERSDSVNHPAHYTAGGSIECIDALEAVASTHKDAVSAFLTCHVLRYIWRWHLKGDALENLEKAEWYLKRLITRVRERENGGSGNGN